MDRAGRFRPTWRAFITDALRGRIALADVERELTAQIERLLDAGVAPTHLDSHKHLHAWPPVFAIVARLRARFGIAAVRVPVERPPLVLFVRHLGDPGVRGQAAANLVLAWWGWLDRRLLRRDGHPAAPRFLGRLHTGFMTDAVLQATAARTRPGTNELMVHPGYEDAALARIPTRLRAARAAEARLLCAPETRRLLLDAGIQLVNHRGASHPPLEPHRHA